MTRLFLIAAIATVSARLGHADSRDVKREIAAQRATADDLSTLDALKAVPEEIALLKTWLDEAVNKPGRAREILDRCVAQTDLIRLDITVSKTKADADEHEKAARATQDKVKATQKALEEATVKKKAMELNVK